MNRHRELDEAGRRAIDKHWRLQNEKTMDLVIGNWVALDGVAAVRRKLQWYLDHLAEFDTST